MERPRKIAINEITTTNLLISFHIGVSPGQAYSAKFAIYPMIVFSPILNTTPHPYPLVHNVPKKATFFVSKTFSGSLHSELLIKGSPSPVKEELSTHISSQLIIQISAGILSPILTSTISPVTNLLAGISCCFPSHITLHCGGIKFLNASMIESD